MSAPLCFWTPRCHSAVPVPWVELLQHEESMQLLFWILGLSNLANGVWMLLAPEHWYQHLPAAVPDTGPLNVHFVRDIGAAFCTVGIALCASAPHAPRRRGVILCVSIFFVLHAVIHVADMLGGRLHHNHWLIDFPGVFLPAIIFGVLCLPRWWPPQEE